MPSSATGDFSLVPSYFVQTGDTVLPVQHNPVLEDVAAGLTNRIMKDGRTVMTGDLKMGGNKVTNVADPALPSDAMTRRVSGFEFETRADAEAWGGVNPMPESIVIRGDASVDDGMGGTFVLGHASDDTMMVNGEIYGRVRSSSAGILEFESKSDLESASIAPLAHEVVVGRIVYFRSADKVLPIATDVIAALPSEPHLTRQIVISKALSRLASSTAWTQVQHLYVFALGLFDWKNPSGVAASLSGSPTTYQNIGIQGDGATAVIDTGINARNVGSASDMHIGAYCIHDYSLDGAALIGTPDTNRLRIVSGTNDFNVRINDGDSTTGGGVAPKTGHFAASRYGTVKKAYIDGRLVHNQVGTTPDASAPDENIVFLHHDGININRYSERTLFGGHMGMALDDGEVMDVSFFFESLKKGMRLRPDHYIQSADGAIWERSHAIDQLPALPINIDSLAGGDEWPILAELDRAGEAQDRAIQSHAIDERGGFIYTTHIKQNTEPGKEGTVINCFPWPSGGIVTPVHYSAPDVRLGHQGLAIQHLDNGDVQFWTGAPYGSEIGDESGNGNYITRFRYANGEISGVEYLKIFDLAGSNQACTPCISYDGQFLIAKQNLPGPRWHIKVFRIDTVTQSNGLDLNGLEFSEFFIDREAPLNADLQGMACLSNVLYIVAEPHGHRKTGKIILAYDLHGVLLGSSYTVNIGSKDCEDNPNGDLMEYEGLAVATIDGEPRLTLTVVAGSSSDKQAMLYALGAKAWGYGTSKEGYAKLPDGTMTAWGVITIAPDVNTMTPGAVAFPAGFVSGIGTSGPKVLVTPYTVGDALDRCSVGEVTSSGCNIYIRRSNATETSVLWTAHGRWR